MRKWLILGCVLVGINIGVTLKHWAWQMDAYQTIQKEIRSLKTRFMVFGRMFTEEESVG